MILSAGTVITHHLSTFTLVLIMALISLAVSVPWLARGEGWVQAAMTGWGLTLITTLIAAAWFHFVAPDTWSYLSPYLGQSLSELMQVANGSSAARQLFGATLSPWWEQKSAYALTVFALGLAVGGLLLIRAQVKNGQLPQGRRRALVCRVRRAGPRVFSVNYLYFYHLRVGGCTPLVGFHMDRIVRAGRPSSGLAD